MMKLLINILFVSFTISLTTKVSEAATVRGGSGNRDRTTATSGLQQSGSSRTYFEPNTRCDLCGIIDGKQPELHYVPREQINTLVDTVIAGMMPCGGLEHAGIEHTFTKDVCESMMRNAGSICCSLPSTPETPAKTSDEHNSKSEASEQNPVRNKDEDDDCDDPDKPPTSPPDKSKASNNNLTTIVPQDTDATRNSIITTFCQRNGHNLLEEAYIEEMCRNVSLSNESSSHGGYNEYHWFKTDS